MLSQSSTVKQAMKEHSLWVRCVELTSSSHLEALDIHAPEKAKLEENYAIYLSFILGIALSHQGGMIDKAKLRCVPFSLQCSEECLLSTQ